MYLLNGYWQASAWQKFLLAGFIIWQLGGCSTAPLIIQSGSTPFDPVRAYTERAALLRATFQGFHLEGRVAMKNEGKGFTAGLSWDQSKTNSVVELTGPLGGTAARLTENVNGARLEMPDKPTLESQDAGQLLHDYFGWDIPVLQMQSWTLGLATANQLPGDLDVRGLPTLLSDQGWQVRFISWQTVEGMLIPARMEMLHDNLSMRLSINTLSHLDPQISPL